MDRKRKTKKQSNKITNIPRLTKLVFAGSATSQAVAIASSASLGHSLYNLSRSYSLGLLASRFCAIVYGHKSRMLVAVDFVIV